MALPNVAIIEPTSSLVFLRRQQVADLIVELTFNEAARQRLPELKGLLIDALYALPPESFIASDWSAILSQVIEGLKLQQDARQTDKMPAMLLGAINQLNRRLQ